MNPRDIAERYFAAIRAQDLDALGALYAEDATFILPNGKAFEGLAAIRAMHKNVFAAGAPFPTPVAIVTGDASVAVEIEARLPDGSVRQTANFYHLDAAAKIARLSVYWRS
jgi:uncharacterized protein (TIGR02246 family)